MPRIINAYDGNSALGDSLSKLGEAIYGDQSKNEVYRQKAFSQKNINDLVTDAAVGLDDPRLAKAQLGIGGTASGTFAGQGRALANDRFTNAATNAAGERNNIRTNAETHYGHDRRYDSDIATTGMNNASSERVAAGNNATSITVGGGNNAATIEAQRIASDRAHQTQLDIADRTPVKVFNDDGSYSYRSAAEVNREHLAPVVTPEEAKGGAIANILRKRTQPSASPFATGVQPWNAAAAAPQPVAPGTVDAGMYGQRTPQELELLGVKSQPVINPGTGETGLSYTAGSTLANGQPAASYVPASNEAVLTQERDNNVRKQAATALPPAPSAYPDTAKDAALTSGAKSLGQGALNETMGALGLGEPFPSVNRARENLQNQAQATRELIASAPGRAAVMDKKWADALIPQPGMLGVTGINATEQMNRSVQLTNHLRDMYQIVQQDAINPNTPPAERVKMEAYLRNLQHVIQLREKVTPEGGTATGAPAGGQLPTFTPEQAAAAAPGTRFLTVDGQERVRH